MMTEVIGDRRGEVEDRLLTIGDLERLFGVHRRTIARLCRRGLFPKPIKVGRQNRWLRVKIEEVMTATA